MFGDVAVFVNPTDERYKHLVNEIVINPVNNQELKILTDPYIEIEFGTGIMKCTPSHDFNDNILGKKHKLPSINIMNNDGTMNSEAGEFEGLDRIKCRKLLVEKLAKNSFVEKIDENYENQIGFSERTDEIVEPIISKQ
jgi:valyl-tRNA synthetase